MWALSTLPSRPCTQLQVEITFDARHSDFGIDYFTVTAMVQDGAAIRVTSSTFKKEPNGDKFKPAGCEVVR